ncbi:hypothetical protein GCM10007359_09840 [Rothia aerolata]|uniref:Uncharacterized protein n=1 Tax=Rothia aerolata TaxID=1812262 RepID=A0A917MSM2_9MICC|nr:hypothetical protein GCM10007359_09840 [Rothia aerolata]
MQAGEAQVGNGKGDDNRKEAREDNADVEVPADGKNNHHQTNAQKRVFQKIHPTSLANLAECLPSVKKWAHG